MEDRGRWNAERGNGGGRFRRTRGRRDKGRNGEAGIATRVVASQGSLPRVTTRVVTNLGRCPRIIPRIVAGPGPLERLVLQSVLASRNGGSIAPGLAIE